MVEHKYQANDKGTGVREPIEITTANGRSFLPGALPQPNMVDHPPHYNKGGYELADVIEAFELPYHLGTVAKYIFRSQYKGSSLEDLRKAEWHLKRQIELEEKNEQ